MSMVVDVVMQHLLSKEVLYQPMKVGGAAGRQGCGPVVGMAGGRGVLVRCAWATSTHPPGGGGGGGTTTHTLNGGTVS
jgi:hypothetical protein